MRWSTNVIGCNLCNLPRGDRHCRGNGTDYQLGCTRGGEPCRHPFSLFLPLSLSFSLSRSLSFHGVAVPPPGARRPRNIRRTGTVVWSRPIRASRRTSRVFCEWAFFLVERGPIAGNEMNRKPRGCPFFFRFAAVARWSWLRITPNSLSLFEEVSKWWGTENGRCGTCWWDAVRGTERNVTTPNCLIPGRAMRELIGNTGARGCVHAGRTLGETATLSRFDARGHRAQFA